MKQVFQSLNLHGNFIHNGNTDWPTQNKNLVNKEYVDFKIGEVTGVDFFKEGQVGGTLYIRNNNVYKLGPIERNNAWEALVLTTTVFNNRPNDTEPTVKMQIGETIVNFTKVDETAENYGFTLQENQHLFRYKCTSNISTSYIGNDSILTIEQIFSQVEINETTYEAETVTVDESLNALTFKFLPVISNRFDEPLEDELEEEIEETYITDLGITTTTSANINTKSLMTLDGANLLPQRYYVVIPENDNLPNNNPSIGFYYWLKDNETNECVSEKTFIDLTDSVQITWCGIVCDVVFFDLGYIDVPNNKLSLVVDSVFY